MESGYGAELTIPVRYPGCLMSTARDAVDVRVLVPATNDLPWIGALSRTGYQQCSADATLPGVIEPR